MPTSITSSKPGRPSGTTKLRPDAPTRHKLFYLARLFCTQAEAAGVLGVTRQTLLTFMARHPQARDEWERGRTCGCVALRKMQWDLAMSGNTTMLIWLGKQYLGQTKSGPSRRGAGEHGRRMLDIDPVTSAPGCSLPTIATVRPSFVIP